MSTKGGGIRLYGVKLWPDTAFSLTLEGIFLCYGFYHTVCHEKCVFHIWSLVKEGANVQSVEYGFSMYEHGKLVNPAEDARFAAIYATYFKHKKDWSDCNFPSLGILKCFIESSTLA